MKKILTSIAAFTLLATTASADLSRVEMGVGSWMQTPSGYASRKDGEGALNLDGTYTSDAKKSNEIYAWMLIKHPIPVVPNLRLEYVSVNDEGKTTGEVNGIGIPAYAFAATTIETKQYDIVPYYNILDNTAWITLDLGLDLKVVQSDVNVQSAFPFPGYASSDTVVIPLLYVRGRVEIPGTNIGLESDVKAITDGTNLVYDVRAKVDYTLDFVPVVQPALELGYRAQKIKVDDGDTQVDLDYSGVYVGLMLRF